MPEAARIQDHFGHVSVWARLARVALRVATGMAEAVIVGAAIVGVAALMATPVGWCGAIFAGGLIAGFIGGATGWSDYKEKKIKELTADIGSPTITGFLTAAGSPDVLINNKAAARAVTDVGVCSQHSGPPIPIAEGSDSVWINTFPAARKGDQLQCAAKIVEGSDNVFIGGNKTAYIEVADDKLWWETGLEIGIGLLMGRGGFGARLGCLGMGMLAGMAADQLGRGFRALIGYPVNPATGGKILTGHEDIDFVLPGPMPIVWARRYSSHDRRSDGLLGTGWSVEPYSIELGIKRAGTPQESLVYVDGAGREVEMPGLRAGHGLHNTAEMFSIGHTPGGFYEVTTYDGILYQFGKPIPGIEWQVLPLQRMRDRNENWIAFRYSDERLLINMADSIGRLLRFEYASGSRRVMAIHLDKSAQDETPGTLTRYEYDVGSQLKAVISRSGQTTRRFEYADTLMTKQEFASGFSCAYAWEAAQSATGPDGDRRVVQHWTNDGESYQIAYDVSADGTGTTTALDQLGRRYRWSWDARQNLTGFEDPLNRVWSLQWDENRRLQGARLPSGDEIKFAYNALGLLVRETDALGRSTRTLWNDRWLQPLQITLPDGGSYKFDYDERGNNTVIVDPAGQETVYSYTRSGLQETMTDAKGGTKRLSWNGRALLAAYTDCSNKTTRYAYDGWGFLKTVTDALGQHTHFTHDAMGRLLGTSQPDNNHQAYSYDPAGHMVGASDALNRSTYFSYSTRGQLLARQDAEGRRISLNYDQGQRLHSLINENGLHFEFTHDPANRVVEERRIGGTRVQIEYDVNDRPIAIVHSPGIGDEDLELAGSGTAHSLSQPLRTGLIRDAVGRLVEKRTASHHYHYRYDSLDQLIEAIKLQLMPGIEGEKSEPFELHPLHRITFEYDKLGNLIAETAIDEITGESHSLRYAHDELGNRTQTILPALDRKPGESRALNYLYYGSGHLHQIDFSHRSGEAAEIHQLISDIERDDLHREIARSQGQLSTRFALDPVGRRSAAWCRPASTTDVFTTQDSTWRQAMDSVGTTQASILNGLMKEYRYDPAGELRQTRHSLQGAASHRYDATGRIEETTRTALSGKAQAPANKAANHEHFAYDPAGNLLNSAMDSGDAQSPVRGYVRDNLVRVFEDKRYAYDGHGRLIRKRSGKHTDQRFEWDVESRLVAVHTTRRPDTEHATTQTTRFDYDALGRRVAKHDAFGSTRFIWEGMRLIEERRGVNIVTYVYEPDSYVPLARLNEKGEVADTGGLGVSKDAFAQRQAVNEGTRPLNEVYYFHTDQVGLPEELSDTSGNLRWRASYKTWGNTVSEQWEVTALDGRPVQQGEQPEIEQNLRFQGQYLDRDTGLHYNTFRFYDPDIGRFISPDPIGLTGGINLGTYALNPLGWIDPLGWAGGLWGGAGQPKTFDSWFNNASVADVKAAMENPVSRNAIHTALRNGGGAHEWFPVSMADKAKELGFSAQELKKLTTPTKDVWFQNVPDPASPGEMLSGPHSTGTALPPGQSGRASSEAHTILMGKLAAAKSKAGALARIRNFAAKYTRGGKSSIGKC